MPVCHRKEPKVKFDQDHKIPRVRGGSDDIDNWQPLCVECNNFKSTACRGCEEDCKKCPWAFPEKYIQIRIKPEIVKLLKNKANQLEVDIHDFTNELIRSNIE